jgi:hypothetical protein
MEIKDRVMTRVFIPFSFVFFIGACLFCGPFPLDKSGFTVGYFAGIFVNFIVLFFVYSILHFGKKSIKK